MTTYLTPTTTAEYTYNTKGLRISKTVSVNGENISQETRHIWDGSNIVMEFIGSDQTDRYIRGNQLIKSDINGYYLYNAHGDVIQLTDQQGTVTTSYLYDAFGIEQEPQSDDPNPFRYCGEYLDKESGNVYLRARYYDPETGRFVSEDSEKGQIDNPLSLNLYTYCSNNPIIYIDPSGNFAISADGKWAHGGAAYDSSSTTISDEEAEKRGLHVFENGVDMGAFKRDQGTGNGASNSMVSSAVKNTVGGTADALLGKTIIDNLPDTRISITSVPSLGPALEMDTETVLYGIKGVKGVSKAAGPIAIGTYGYDVYNDYHDYNNHRRKAIFARTVGFGLTVGVGAAAAFFGAPAVVAVGLGVVAGVAVDRAVTSYQNKYCR